MNIKKEKKAVKFTKNRKKSSLSKLKNVLCWFIETYYDVDDSVQYHKGTYVRKIDDDTYDLVQCEASKEWQNRLSS